MTRHAIYRANTPANFKHEMPMKANAEAQGETTTRRHEMELLLWLWLWLMRRFSEDHAKADLSREAAFP
jgi:hypothetical protein